MVEAYYYTNEKAYRSMLTGSEYGKAGLLPIPRFIPLNKGGNLPEEAYVGVVHALLEPEPRSWLRNADVPNVWTWLMGGVCREESVVLLSFDIKPGDGAFVVDRVHVQKMLIQWTRPTKAEMNEAYRRYWESRVPILEYAGGYSMPEVVIQSRIAPSRLRVEWTKSTDEFWNDVLRKDPEPPRLLRST